jgi:hypothetical protein
MSERSKRIPDLCGDVAHRAIASAFAISSSGPEPSNWM